MVALPLLARQPRRRSEWILCFLKRITPRERCTPGTDKGQTLNRVSGRQRREPILSPPSVHEVLANVLISGHRYRLKELRKRVHLPE
jgi:hypothetical protein